MIVCLLQLGPNPTFLGDVQLGQGQSGKLLDGGTLYLVNKNHPFKLLYDLNSNGAAAGMKGRKSTEKTKEGSKGSLNSKRSIKDFFPTSPMKVR